MSTKGPSIDAETIRLQEDERREKNWKRWGPYLSERQWGTVREDYSADGDAWHHFPHEHARSRAYRWGEDGLLGITDRECRLCFGLALWNGRDPILKERLFGLTGPEGNHGEDVKESYFYLDSTPTHSYLKGLYKYPQSEFPYRRLLEESQRRSRLDPEFELGDAGGFDENRYFDVVAEYAKAAPEDVLIRITVANRGPEAAAIHVLPTLWFRNTWSWGRTGEGYGAKPRIALRGAASAMAEHATLGRLVLFCDDEPDGGEPELIFTNNETNVERVFGGEKVPYAKDAFHDYVIGSRTEAVHPGCVGTKAAAVCRFEIPPGEERVLRLRLVAEALAPKDPFGYEFEETFDLRILEADEFYQRWIPDSLDQEERRATRQAYAGLLWTKQFFHYVVKDWLEGDPVGPPPPASRKDGRNADWIHLYNRDVVSMPDKWEYPWYAAWDLAFHMVPFARIDPEFAKQQLSLFLREWYMHPNGQLPAYEWNFSDVNPPVHAWACWRVYKISAARGQRDVRFLASAFQKLLMNFTWWVNRKDPQGKHIFAGGFLGLDNIGVFDRSSALPAGGRLDQADGTAWMAFYCSTMLSIALELARDDPSYEDVASKFFEHFVAISDAINSLGGSGLWDDGDGFYYDRLLFDHSVSPLKVRSLVGVIPLFAATILDDDEVEQLPGFSRRMQWFLEHQPELARHITHRRLDGRASGQRLLAIPPRDRLEKVLRYVFDESEFFSPHGIRSLSQVHRDRPYVFHLDGAEHRVDYAPGESPTGMFGGNSNWRGPIWFPLNYLLLEALEFYDHFYGESLKVELPTGSGRWVRLGEAARELGTRLSRPFVPDGTGHRPCHGGDERFATDPHWKDLVLFHEYFHGETGRGLGASHQTGWTALVAKVLEDLGRGREAVAQESGTRPTLHAVESGGGTAV